MLSREHTGAGSALLRLAIEPKRIGYAIAVAALAVLALALARGHSGLALAFACLLTAAVSAIVRPALFRVIAFVGLAVLPFATAAPFLAPEDHSYNAYLAAGAVALVVLGLLQPRALPRTLGMCYLVFILLASSFTALRAGETASIDAIAYLVMGVAMYVLVLRAARMERRILLAALLTMASIQSVLAISQALFGWPVFEVVLSDLWVSERNYFAYLLPGVTTEAVQGSGTFLHFNFLGAVLALFVPLAFGLWATHVRSLWRAGLFVLLGAGLIATFSRGALVGAVAGIVVILLLERSRSRRSMYVLMICAATLVALLAMNTFAQYYESTSNVSVRVSTWKVALNNALGEPSNLLLGYGFNHFHGDVLASGLGGQSLTVESSIMAALHSGYLQILLEFGLIGAVLFVLWLVSVGKKALRRPRAPLRIVLLGSAVGFLLHQALDNAMFYYAGALFIVVMALLEADARDDEESVHDLDPQL